MCIVHATDAPHIAQWWMNEYFKRCSRWRIVSVYIYFIFACLMPHTLEEWQQYETNRQQLPQPPKYAHKAHCILCRILRAPCLLCFTFRFRVSFAMLARSLALVSVPLVRYDSAHDIRSSFSLIVGSLHKTNCSRCLFFFFFVRGPKKFTIRVLSLKDISSNSRSSSSSYTPWANLMKIARRTRFRQLIWKCARCTMHKKPFSNCTNYKVCISSENSILDTIAILPRHVFHCK